MGGSGSNHKVYAGVIGRADTAGAASASFAAGERWKWRGGWSIQSPDLDPSGILAIGQVLQNGRSRQVVVTSAQRVALVPYGKARSLHQRCVYHCLVPVKAASVIRRNMIIRL